MTTYCTHHDCRCITAAELAYMASVLRRSDLLAAAVQVHDREVPCRRDDAQPRPALRPGPANTHIPLYKKEAA